MNTQVKQIFKDRRHFIGHTVSSGVFFSGTMIHIHWWKRISLSQMENTQHARKFSKANLIFKTINAMAISKNHVGHISVGGVDPGQSRFEHGFRLISLDLGLIHQIHDAFLIRD